VGTVPRLLPRLLRPRNKEHSMPDEPDNSGSHRAAILGAIAVAVLVVVGWLLARELSESSRLQDCVMSGRTNCAPIDTR
jgi:hypothetical protein